MDELKELQGVCHIQINREEGTLFIEKSENDGVAIDLGIHELMHLLNEFTEEEWGKEEIYGVKDNI